MKIAFIEDNSDLREELTFQLTHLEHLVYPFPAGKPYLDWLLSNPKHDALLLDLGLPDLDGLLIAKQVREINPDVYVIMITARSSIDSKVEGWNAGANFYLPKPVDLNELEAILNSLHIKKNTHLSPSLSELTLNKIDLTLANQEHKILKLSYIECLLLSAMNNSLSVPLSRNELIHAIHENPSHYDPRRLEAIMSRLRKKLNDYGCDKSVIQAVRGKGYMLTVALSVM